MYNLTLKPFRVSPAEAESLKDKLLVKVNKLPSEIKKHGDEWSNAIEFEKWHKAKFSFQKRKSTKRKSTKRKSGKRKSGKRKSTKRKSIRRKSAVRKY